MCSSRLQDITRYSNSCYVPIYTIALNLKVVLEINISRGRHIVHFSSGLARFFGMPNVSCTSRLRSFNSEHLNVFRAAPPISFFMRPLSRLVRYSGYGEIWLQHTTQSRRELWVETSRIEPSSLQLLKYRIARFSTYKPLCEKDEKPITRPTPVPKLDTLKAASEPAVRVVPAETLPSHREAQRWVFSKRTHALLDDLMQRLSVAGQQINKYTGTDYTPIEALRHEIKEQGSNFANVIKYCH
jgi:hypothetical protein